MTKFTIKFKVLLQIISIISIGFYSGQTALAKKDKNFSATEKNQIEKMIHDYILKHPEIIPEAIELFKKNPKAVARFRAKIEKEQKQKILKILKNDNGMIYNDQISPVLGNPNGDITLVEFYDYKCGYCKRSLSIIKNLIKTDPNLKVIFKELPILSEISRTAAIISLAVNKQGKFEEFHTALMQTKKNLTEKVIFEIAAKNGVNISKLKKDMNDPLIERALRDNHILATKLGIEGTPGFIIGDTIIPGYVQSNVLREAIRKARNKNKE